MGIDAATMKFISEIDHRMAMEAIARGRTALLAPLPVPLCARQGATERRMNRSDGFMAKHRIRCGELLMRPVDRKASSFWDEPL